jgi:hypothetical protein
MNGGLKSLIPVTPDDELLIKLRKGVLYVGLYDPSTADLHKIRAKVIDVNATKAYKPANDTTAVLLYFLSRENSDPVLLEDYTEIFTKKFNTPTLDVKPAIITFLQEIDAKYILDVKKVPSGTIGANKGALDPVDLLNTITTWQTPSLVDDINRPICKTTTYYSAGHIAFNVQR